MSERDADYASGTPRPPKASTFPAGGVGNVDVRCSRCGEKASRSYEGVEPLDLCESCYRALGRWLDGE